MNDGGDNPGIREKGLHKRKLYLDGMLSCMNLADSVAVRTLGQQSGGDLFINQAVAQRSAKSTPPKLMMRPSPITAGREAR